MRQNFGGGSENRTPNFAVQRRRVTTSTNPPKMVVPVGSDPTTLVLSRLCSSNWAKGLWGDRRISKPQHLVSQTSALPLSYCHHTIVLFIWCAWRDLNPQDLVSKTSMFTNFITRAKLVGLTDYISSLHNQLWQVRYLDCHYRSAVQSCPFSFYEWSVRSIQPWQRYLPNRLSLPQT